MKITFESWIRKVKYYRYINYQREKLRYYLSNHRGIDITDVYCEWKRIPLYLSAETYGNKSHRNFGWYKGATNSIWTPRAEKLKNRMRIKALRNKWKRILQQETKEYYENRNRSTRSIDSYY